MIILDQRQRYQSNENKKKQLIALKKKQNKIREFSIRRLINELWFVCFLFSCVFEEALI